MKKKTLTALTGMVICITMLVTGCAGTAGTAGAMTEDTGSSVQASADTASKSATSVTDTGQDTGDGISVDAEGTDVAAMDPASDDILSAEDIKINETIENSTDEEHAITADGEEASYANIAIVKTGDAEGDEADFYGANAAVFATNGAALALNNITVTTDGRHANGVFSYGEGTIVNISDSVIETTGNCSGGLMTTGGGTMNASNLTIHTTGNSSAAIRSDRGGGTVNVIGGSYTTDGTGSPVIYSTADITVSNSMMESTASQGVVVEGKNSVTLNGVDLTAGNTTKNSDKSQWYQAVMIYQSMSGDAAEGLASFAMNGGSLTNLNGDIFFVNNTTATIDLNGARIINNDENGVFLRAAAAGWGRDGNNGGHVTMTAAQQTIDGDMVVDEISSLNLYLKDGSSFTGAVNTDGTGGDVYVEIEDGSTWVLTGDSYITGLTCGTGGIDLSGHKLYVNGEEYMEGSVSEGSAIEVEASSVSSHGGLGDDGNTPPSKPKGKSKSDNGGQKPSKKPDGDTVEPAS